MDKPRILIVEDDNQVRTQMKWALAQHYDVLLADDRSSAVQILNNMRPDVVTLDLSLPPSPEDSCEGFLTLADMLSFDPFLKVVVITEQSERKNEAIGQGAYDFFASR